MNRLAEALNELFQAHKYVFHHGADGLVHKRWNGHDIAGFGKLQLELVMKLNGVPVRLHVNRDIGIVGINLFGAPRNQMPQQGRRGSRNIRAADVNDSPLSRFGPLVRFQ